MSCPKIPTQFPVKAVVLGGGKGARAYSPSEKRACNSHSDCTNIEIFSVTKNINIAQHVHANTASIEHVLKIVTLKNFDGCTSYMPSSPKEYISPWWRVTLCYH